MRKIICDACKNRYGDHGLWVVFHGVVICESCRITVIEWFKESSFGLGHPFVQEFMIVKPNRKK